MTTIVTAEMDGSVTISKCIKGQSFAVPITHHEIPGVVEGLKNRFNAHRSEHTAKQIMRKLGLDQLRSYSISQDTKALVLRLVEAELDQITSDRPGDMV